MQGSDHHVEEVLRHSRAIRSETSALLGELRGSAEEIGRALDLKGRLEKGPWLTLSAAAAVGYVLGGGLFTPLSSRLFKLGVRVLFMPLVRAQLLGLAGGLGGSTARQGYSPGSEDGSGGL